jgi:NTE family protein
VNEEPREPIETPEPAQPIPDAIGDKLEEGVALCLSGGGYRAMLFHVGSLWRLNDSGYLPRLKRISSVSGGSITAAQLAVAWPELDFSAGPAPQFVERVAAPLRRLGGETIDFSGIFRGILTPGSISEKVAAAYKKHLFGDRTLQDLPDDPRFVINATNLQSAVLWRFSKPYMRDYRVGEVRAPRLELASAVAASGAFPPLLSPVTLRPKPTEWTPGSGLDLQRPPFTEKVFLTDGGVYDNLGLETAWKRYRTILISNGGGHIGGQPNPKKDWLRQPLRVLSVIDSQVRALRAQQAIDSFTSGVRDGAYWDIRTNISDYGLTDALPCPPEAVRALARVPTRLKKTDETTQERLINWGYAVCDAAMRRYVDPAKSAPSGFPYVSSGVG